MRYIYTEIRPRLARPRYQTYATGSSWNLIQDILYVQWGTHISKFAMVGVKQQDFIDTCIIFPYLKPPRIDMNAT